MGRKWQSRVDNGKQTAEVAMVMRLVYVLGYGIELIEIGPPTNFFDLVEAFAKHDDYAA